MVSKGVQRFARRRNQFLFTSGSCTQSPWGCTRVLLLRAGASVPLHAVYIAIYGLGGLARVHFPF